MPSASTNIAPDAKASDVQAILTKATLGHATIGASVAAK